MRKRTLYWILAALFAATAIYAPFDNTVETGIGITVATIIVLIALAVGMAALAMKTDPEARFKRRPRRRRTGRMQLPRDYVCFDLETTGLLKDDPRITELGAVRVRNGRVSGTYGQLVNPGIPIPANVTRLTGIDDSMVAGSPTIAQALPGFLEFCGNDVLIGHNINQFDVPVIQLEAQRSGIKLRQYQTVDTLPLSQALCPGLKRYSVAALIKTFGIATTESHRAVDDAMQTAQIYEELRKRA